MMNHVTLSERAMLVSLSNGSTLKLRMVNQHRHVPKLMRNLISVDQLADGGMKTTFDGGCHGEVHSKKEGTLYMMSGSGSSISVASPELDARVWHHRLGHMSEQE